MRSAQAMGSSSASGRKRFQSCERAAEQGQLALEGGGAHASVACTRAMCIRGVINVELLARAGPVDHGAVLNQHDIGGTLEVASLTFGGRTEKAQQRFKLPCGDGSA